MTLGPSTLALLFLAALGAGFVDAVAGGGGLLTLPALLAAHVPIPLALGTNKGQSSFGATSSAVAFWRKGAIDRRRAPVAFVLGAVGALGGAALLMRLRPEPLKPIVIGLLVAVAVFVAARPKVTSTGLRVEARPWALVGAALCLGAYDGFFGPGTGTMLIVAFTVIYGESATSASANAKVVNLASNLASLALFASRGRVLWHVALPMALGNAVGAALGARVALAGGDRYVRAMLFLVVTALVAKLTYDLLR